MVRSIISFVITCALVFLLITNSSANDKLSVFVSIAPQKYFVKQVGKDLVDVQVMVPPGADPHTYEPKPKEMVAITKAKLYFAAGIEFEKANLNKITSTNPHIKVIHTDHGIQKIPMKTHHHGEREHKEEKNHRKTQLHEEGDHAHKNDHHVREGLDPHIWLSPPLVMAQARSILSALQEADPVHDSDYLSNYNVFMSSLENLDAELKNIFAGKQGLQFMVFHPAWGYFAHAYGLEQVPIEIEGKNPKPADLKELIQHARQKNIKVIFAQPQFSAKNAALVAREIGGQVAFADPLAENWLANLREVAEKFKLALR